MKKLFLFLLLSLPCLGATYYVSNSGSDEAAGTAEGTAWKTLFKVESTTLSAGDSVLFKRGDTWRCRLDVSSGTAGSPITYGAYGTGARPRICNSYSLTNWTSLGDNLWSSRIGGTSTLQSNLFSQSFRFETNSWLVSTSSAYCTVATIATDPREYEITGVDNGTLASHIQFYTAPLLITNDATYEFRFQAKCTTPFSLTYSSIAKNVSPFTSYAPISNDPFYNSVLSITTDYQTFTKQFVSTFESTNARVLVYLGGVLPDESVFSFKPLSFSKVVSYQDAPINLDVGNIVINETAGAWKKWNREDVTNHLAFWHDPVGRRVILCSTTNPNTYSSVDLVLRDYSIYANGKANVVIQDIACMFSAMGIVLSPSSTVTANGNIVITNCDIGWIGGNLQSLASTGPVRYGNGINLENSNTNILISGNRLWQCYDAGITPQSALTSRLLRNVTNINNVIWDCEYGLEMTYSSSQLTNIYYLNNTIYNSGGAWSHSHRPIQNGRHLMSYYMSAGNSNIVLLNNIFHTASESAYRIAQTNWFGDDGLISDYNVFYPGDASVIARLSSTDVDWATWQAYSQDANSITNDPQLTSVSTLNFTPAAGSPALTSGEGGTQAGSALRLTE